MTAEEFISEWNNDSEYVSVHTSGSTGVPKQMWVEKRRMEASARITCDFLGLTPGDTALLCMSPDFIAGKMMIVRSLIRSLRLTVVEPSGHPLASVPHVSTQDSLAAVDSPFSYDFVAMVPMQVYNSLQVPAERERLMAIRHLIIGGGAIDDGLAQELKRFPHAVWSTYGMTETLSHIAMRRLSGNGASEWYTPLDHVEVSLDADHCLVIDAPLVTAGRLTTHDIAELSADGRHFRIIGRRDNVICSGGIKIQIEEVERLLRPHIRAPFVITKCRDTKFGETVVLLTQTADPVALRTVCEQHLPAYWRPRHYVHTDRIPFTATGKPARADIEQLVEALLTDHAS